MSSFRGVTEYSITLLSQLYKENLINTTDHNCKREKIKRDNDSIGNVWVAGKGEPSRSSFTDSVTTEWYTRKRMLF